MGISPNDPPWADEMMKIKRHQNTYDRKQNGVTIFPKKPAWVLEL